MLARNDRRGLGVIWHFGRDKGWLALGQSWRGFGGERRLSFEAGLFDASWPRRRSRCGSFSSLFWLDRADEAVAFGLAAHAVCLRVFDRR